MARVLAVVTALAAVVGGLLVVAGRDADDTAAPPDESTAVPVTGQVRITGSSAVEPLSMKIAERLADTHPGIVVSADGPGGEGFELFCDSAADLAGASRPMTDVEAERCDANEVEHVELVVAFEAIAVIAHPDHPIGCLSVADLYGLLSREAEQGGVGRWSDAERIEPPLDLSQELPDVALDLAVPGTESRAYDLLIDLALRELADERGQIDAVRTDIAGQADEATIVERVASSPSGLGWVGLGTAAAEADVRVLEIDDGGGGCTAATPASVRTGTYALGRPLLLYVDLRAARANPALVAFVDAHLDERAYAQAIAETSSSTLVPADLRQARATWAAARP
ncbi:MAG: substrate-binding domain-containing protein [Actinomycetota bacterium]